MEIVTRNLPDSLPFSTTGSSTSDLSPDSVMVSGSKLNGFNSKEKVITKNSELPSAVGQETSVLQKANFDSPQLSEGQESDEPKEQTKQNASKKQKSAKKQKSSKKKEKLNNKNRKASNKYDNDNKARAHLLALGSVGIISLALVPFTAGASLLAGVIVMSCGNTALMAMYGGSQYELGQPQNRIDDKPEDKDELIPSDIDGKPSLELPELLDVDEDEVPKPVIPPESYGTEHIDGELPLEEVEPLPPLPSTKAELIKHLTERFASESVISFANEDFGELDQSDFMEQLKRAATSEEDGYLLNEEPVASAMIHFGNGVKIYVGEIKQPNVGQGIVASIPHGNPSLDDVTAPEPQKVGVRKWPTVPVVKGVKTSEGSNSGRSMAIPEVRPAPILPQPSKPENGQWPTVPAVKGLKTSEGSNSGRSMAIPEVRTTPILPQPSKPENGQWPTVPAVKGLKTSEGSNSGRSMAIPEVRPAPVFPQSVKPENGQWSTVPAVKGLKTSEGSNSGRSMAIPETKPAPVLSQSSKPENGQWSTVPAVKGLKTSEGSNSGRSMAIPETKSSFSFPREDRPTEGWPAVKINKGIKTSEGSISGRGGNFNTEPKNNSLTINIASVIGSQSLYAQDMKIGPLNAKKHHKIAEQLNSDSGVTRERTSSIFGRVVAYPVKRERLVSA